MIRLSDPSFPCNSKSDTAMTGNLGCLQNIPKPSDSAMQESATVGPTILENKYFIGCDSDMDGSKRRHALLGCCARR